MRSLSVYLICCLLLGTLACGPVTALLRPTATLSPTTVVPVETATTVPPATEPPTSTPVPTATTVPRTPTVPPATAPPASAACPPPGSPRPVQPASFSDYPDAIEQYLSAGGDLETLRSALGGWGVLPDAEDQAVSAATAADLTGDGAEEVILALARPDAGTIIRPGLLLVFGCSEGRYVNVYREGRADVEMFDPALELVRVGDANLDGLPDVAYVVRTCGAHTCFEQL
ncbi:MAG: hypothetical protein PVI63_05925, partial [Anaerolineae bacterium]